MIESPQVPINTTSFEGLREYYHLRSLILWNTYHELGSRLEERVQSIIDRYQEDDPQLAQILSKELHYVRIQLSTEMRYALLPRFLSLLEKVIKRLCEIVDPESYSCVRQQKWLKNHLDFLNDKDVHLDEIEKDVKALYQLIKIRDCIIHANGEIDACKNPEEVRKAIAAIDTATELKDGLVFLGDQVIPTAQDVMSNILVKFFDHFGYPLNWTRWY
ncbi:MAG: hypothetical protein MI725_14085 [Pirellulales bacterium]|nr:hypothetical protein [Pirellulales bacterium]